MKFPGFCGPSYVSESKLANAERAINLYPESIESPASSASVVLYPTPGFKAFASVDQSPCRGLFAQGGRAFVAAGAVFYEILSTGATVARGAILNDNGPVTIVSNGEGGGQLFIASGGRGYVFDLSANTLTQVLTSAHFGGYLDGWFLSLDINTSQLRVSNLLDGTVWPGAAFAQRQSGGDPWRALAVHSGGLWLFGEETTDVWYNAGAFPFPLAPIPGAFLNQGIAAPYSIARLGTTLAWLTRNDQGDGQVVIAEGYQARRISTHAIEQAIAGYSTIADAVGWAYQERGHSFYVLTFPTAGATWCFDASTGTWHERAYWNRPAMQLEAMRAQFHCFAFGRHLVADRVTGTVYEMSKDYSTDVDGFGVRRIRRAARVAADKRRVVFRSLQLDLDVGLALTSGEGSDPEVMLRWSDDGGYTWSSERVASIGRQGQYGARVVWHRLGMGRDRVFEVSFTDPIPFRIVDAFLEAAATGH